MITLLLACAAPDSDTTTPTFGADTDTKATESPQVVTVVEDLGACGAEEELDVRAPDGQLVGLQSSIVYEDGRTLYRSDATAYVDDGWVVVRCTEGQPVTVIMWVLTE